MSFLNLGTIVGDYLGGKKNQNRRGVYVTPNIQLFFIKGE